MFCYVLTMLTNIGIGKFGESVAQRYYERKGFKLFHKNFRFKNYEIDLVFADKGRLVFVEVKTRKYSGYEQKELVSSKKLSSLKTAIYLYLQQNGHNSLENWELDLFALDIENKQKPRLTVLPLLQGFG